MLFLHSPVNFSTPIDDGLGIYRRVMDNLHVLPGSPDEVNHLIRSSLERMRKLFPSREPEEISCFDFLIPGLGLPVFIEEDASAFSGFKDVEPFVLVAVPVCNGTDVVRRNGADVDAALGQPTFVTEV